MSRGSKGESMTDNADTEYCKTEDLENTLKISIYFEKGCIKLFLSAFVLAWIGVEILMIMDFVTNMSTTGFEIAWTLIGGIGSYAALWSAWGKEVIEVSSSEIVIQRSLLGMGPPKAYFFENIDSLSIETHRYSVPEDETPGNWSEITFGYKSKIISFGRHRSQQELNKILNAIVGKFPQYEEKIIFTKS